VPENCHQQSAITSFYENSTNDLGIRRKIRAIASKAEIDTRYSVIADFSRIPDDFTFFAKNSSLEPEPNLTQRMACFKNEAFKLAIETIKKIKHKVEQLDKTVLQITPLNKTTFQAKVKIRPMHQFDDCIHQN
jgi:hypothetical protein